MNDIIVPPTDDILDELPISPSTRREIADILGRIGDKKVFATSMNKEISSKEYLAIMIWDLVTNGYFNFMDGTRLDIEDVDQWMSIVKFVANHLDGPVGRDLSVTANIYKIYQDIDIDRV